MERGNQHRLTRQLVFALRPIAKLLLASGVNYRLFAEAAKRAFVDIATSEYGIRMRPANTARVAIITGLTRKEVKRLREQNESTLDLGKQQSAIPADVLHFWHTDPNYVSTNGYPLELAYMGPEVSFASLVRRTGADVSPAAVLAELKRMGAVVELSSGMLQAKQRYYVPVDLEDLVAEALRFGVTTIAGTVAFNAVAKRDGRPGRRFQRVVESIAIPEARTPEVKAFLEGELWRFSEAIDDAISSYATKAGEPHLGAPKRRIGVGLYYFEED